MTLGVAIIGSGIFAKQEHLPAVKSCPLFKLKAVYSRSRASAEELVNAAGDDIDIYSDDSGPGNTYSDLLQRSDIAAVILALPILSQPDYIEKALSAGKHVLSEKPIAPDLQTAEQLLAFYNTKIDKSKVTWAVAENFRYRDCFLYARQEIEKLGRILGFEVKSYTNVKPGGAYFETAWRKTPSHQGGFVLDGGVHYIAALRHLLGQDAKPTAVSAFTTLLRPHLPPVDTVNAIWHCKSGISGTWSASFGTTLFGSEYTVACEEGSVTVYYDKVVVRSGEQKAGVSEEKEFPYTSGVAEEVAAWAESIVAQRPNPKQSPEEGLADLEILEKMLKSGEALGKVESLQFQV